MGTLNQKKILKNGIKRPPSDHVVHVFMEDAISNNISQNSNCAIVIE